MVNRYIRYPIIKEQSSEAEQRLIVEKLTYDKNPDNLWLAIIAFQNYQFYTYTGLPFKYSLKLGKDGKYNRELIINRRKNSKTLTWSSIEGAYKQALCLQGDIVKRPKELGDFFGVSYIYSMFYTWGIIEVPELIREVMVRGYSEFHGR